MKDSCRACRQPYRAHVYPCPRIPCCWCGTSEGSLCGRCGKYLSSSVERLRKTGPLYQQHYHRLQTQCDACSGAAPALSFEELPT